MARPPNADSAATYEKIREAALRLLRASGPDALSVRRVAKEAGVGVGTLRYYFDTREALLEACLDSYHESLIQLENQMAEQLRNSKNPKQDVVNIVRASFMLLSSQPALPRLRMLISVQKGGLPHSRRTKLRGPFVQHASEILAEVTNASPIEIRLTITSIMRLVNWYATCSDEEAMDVSGAEDASKARELLREHCARVAVLQLFPGEEPDAETSNLNPSVGVRPASEVGEIKGSEQN